MELLQKKKSPFSGGGIYILNATVNIAAGSKGGEP